MVINGNQKCNYKVSLELKLTLSSASAMASGFRMSQEIGRTGFFVKELISAAVASNTGRRLKMNEK